MRVFKSKNEVIAFLNETNQPFFERGPLLIESYLENAKEVDIDAISDGQDVYIAGIMEHFEQAGIHSGDSTCSFPSFSLSEDILKEIRKCTITLCQALKIQGLINIQFAIKAEELFIIEVNPRASRTIPFISKARGIPFAQLATQIMMGKRLSELTIPKERHPNYVHVKQPIFSFSHLPEVDPFLNSTMKSTGEVMGTGQNLTEATAKAFLSILRKKPKTNIILIRVTQNEELEVVPIINEMIKLGYQIKLVSENKGILQNFHSLNTTIEVIPFNKGTLIEERHFSNISIIINTSVMHP